MSWLTKTSEYLETIKKIGFEQLLKVDFKGEENRDDAFYIFWDAKRGILLCFDTWGITVHSGDFYYNWIPKNIQVAYKHTSSGGFEKHNDGLVWVGRHNCKNDIDKSIRNLEENGKFVVPWIHRPFLWLLHHKDKERYSNIVDCEYKLVNERRILQLPKDVQIAIRGIEK